MNPYGDATTPRQVIEKAVGAGAYCWTSPSRAGDYRPDMAEGIVNDAVERIAQLNDWTDAVQPTSEERAAPTGCVLEFTDPGGTTYLLQASLQSSSLHVLTQRLADSMSVETRATFQAMTKIISDALREPGES